MKYRKENKEKLSVPNSGTLANFECVSKGKNSLAAHFFKITVQVKNNLGFSWSFNLQ